MSAYDTPEQEISEGGDAVLSQPFLTESQRLALDAALAAKAATLTTEGGKEAHHDKTTAGAHHLLHGKPGDRKSRMGKGSRATKGTGTKKGGAGGKFTWGDLLCESREGHGMEALDENDPNYDSDGREQSGAAAAEPLQPPRPRRRGLAAKIEAYKEEVMSILQEYFSSGDIDEAATSLQEMDLPMYDYYFVKRGLTMAMDRKDHDREMVSTILSALYGEVITPDQMQKGFAAVVESLDDLLLDVPNAVELMSLFVCRAVVDDILPPSFIARMPSPTGTPIAALKQKCELHLGARHCGERLLRCWGKGAGIVLAETKESITMSLKEYLVSGQAAEVAANLRALDVPFFHHELVKQAVETALEQPKHTAAVVRLLKELSSSLLISGLQMAKGFCRVAEQLDDLVLDNPAAPERFKELVAIVASEGVVENAESLLLPGKAAEAVEEDTRPSDELATYKASINTTLREYFDSAEAREVVRRLEGSEHPQYHHVFVKHAVRLAMDRRDHERELVSLVLVEVAQAPGCVLPEQIARGFTHLLMEVDDTVLDVPNAVQLEALFLGRAIVDEVLPPVFLTDVIRSLRADSLGLSVVRRAGSILSARHASERLLGCWRGGATSVVQLREKIKLALQEFLNTRDVQEIGRCLHDLGYPYFRHEVVFQAMELAFGNEGQMDQVAHLLCALSKYGDINQTQMLTGFNRTERCLPDLALDYPHAEAVFSRIKDQAVQDGWLIPPC